ncbi:hypothetical protein KSP39_PZI009456 [Platanthera zijinensis]|uniref:Uncharacterized protein n=1 Tax=Platanthera zijinensis TaxID=2320716 RepID=A0AAP0BMP2_9ASPA
MKTTKRPKKTMASKVSDPPTPFEQVAASTSNLARSANTQKLLNDLVNRSRLLGEEVSAVRREIARAEGNIMLARLRINGYLVEGDKQLTVGELIPELLVEESTLPDRVPSSALGSSDSGDAGLAAHLHAILTINTWGPSWSPPRRLSAGPWILNPNQLFVMESAPCGRIGVTPSCHPDISTRGSALESTKAAFTSSADRTPQSALRHGVSTIRQVVEVRDRTPDLLDMSISTDQLVIRALLKDND